MMTATFREKCIVAIVDYCVQEGGNLDMLVGYISEYEGQSSEGSYWDRFDNTGQAIENFFDWAGFDIPDEGVEPGVANSINPLVATPPSTVAGKGGEVTPVVDLCELRRRKTWEQASGEVMAAMTAKTEEGVREMIKLYPFYSHVAKDKVLGDKLGQIVAVILYQFMAMDELTCIANALAHLKVATYLGVVIGMKMHEEMS